MENPFSKFKIGQLLDARIVVKPGESRKSEKGYQWELSVRPSLLTGALDIFSFSFHYILNM